MGKSFLIVVVSLFFFASCSQISTYVAVIQGNYAFHSGDYQEAIISYLNTDVPEEQRRLIAYNLGNVYYALGEIPAADISWEIASDSGYEDVEFQAFYNRGVLNYELGRYALAYDNFLKALKMNSQDIDTKVNLELSLLKMNARREEQLELADDSSFEASENAKRILQYIELQQSEQYNPQSQEFNGGVHDW